MKTILFILTLIYLIHSESILPSEEIWQNVRESIENGSMIWNKYHFIYDENNFTKLDINGEKMNNLYKKQEEIYLKNNNLQNYIFIVKTLNDNIDLIESIILDLGKLIKRDYEINNNNSVIALVVIDDRKIAISTENDKISENEKISIINNIKIYMQNEQYYDAWNKLIDDFDYYYNIFPVLEEEDNIWVLWIILGFFGVLAIIGGIWKIIDGPALRNEDNYDDNNRGGFGKQSLSNDENYGGGGGGGGVVVGGW